MTTTTIILAFAPMDTEANNVQSMWTGAHRVLAKMELLAANVRIPSVANAVWDGRANCATLKWCRVRMLLAVRALSSALSAIMDRAKTLVTPTNVTAIKDTPDRTVRRKSTSAIRRHAKTTVCAKISLEPTSAFAAQDSRVKIVSSTSTIASQILVKMVELATI